MAILFDGKKDFISKDIDTGGVTNSKGGAVFVYKNGTTIYVPIEDMKTDPSDQRWHTLIVGGDEEAE